MAGTPNSSIPIGIAEIIDINAVKIPIIPIVSTDIFDFGITFTFSDIIKFSLSVVINIAALRLLFLLCNEKSKMSTKKYKKFTFKKSRVIRQISFKILFAYPK